MLVVPDNGEAQALAILLNKLPAADLDVILFKNNYTPDSDTAIGDLTEATFTGYSRVALDAGDWVITPGAPSVAVQPQVAFTSSAGSQSENVYGYAIVERDSDQLVRWAERFDNGPYLIQNNGDEIKVTPRFEGASESGD